MNRHGMIAVVAAVSLTTSRLAAQVTAPIDKPAPARVVFVCEHGTVKSLVALEYFKHLARARGLQIDASSRGTNPDSLVPSLVRTGLEADGFDVSPFRPQRFTRADLGPGALVIALDADVESVVRNTTDVLRWDGLPSVMADYVGARNALVVRVERLVDSLARKQGIR